MSSPSILKETRRIFKEEGFRAFWKGNGVTIVHRLPYSSINFFAYEQYKMVSNHTITRSEQADSPKIYVSDEIVVGLISCVIPVTFYNILPISIRIRTFICKDDDTLSLLAAL